jgi:hypothetical protein
MSTIPNIHRNPEQIGIADLIAYIEQVVSTGMVWDPFSAARHLEHMGVAAGYMREYYDYQGRRPSLFDLAALDGDTVADRIATDLDREGKAGIAHSVTLLVEHARRLLDETSVTAEDVVSALPRGWNVSTHCEAAAPSPVPTGGHALPSCIHITIELPGSNPGDGPSGGDSTVTLR